ncbi:hypothetical protein PybrP1_004498 [[Pythium] brassicae (nom. inval.)]|nr:hypothetical protein PybrP1_004498 [[Pythium] brassicae (nom. inval.)]
MLWAASSQQPHVPCRRGTCSGSQPPSGCSWRAAPAQAPRVSTLLPPPHPPSQTSPHLLELADLQRKVADLLVVLLLQQPLRLLAAVGCATAAKLLHASAHVFTRQVSAFFISACISSGIHETHRRAGEERVSRGRRAVVVHAVVHARRPAAACDSSCLSANISSCWRLGWIIPTTASDRTMDLLSKWKQRQPLSDIVDLEMLGPELLASRHQGLSIDLAEGNRKSSRTPVLLIDEKGNATPQEMRRADILKMTHEAAHTCSPPLNSMSMDPAASAETSKAASLRHPELPPQAPRREARRSFSTAYSGSGGGPPVRVTKCCLYPLERSVQGEWFD